MKPPDAERRVAVNVPNSLAISCAPVGSHRFLSCAASECMTSIHKKFAKCGIHSRTRQRVRGCGERESGADCDVIGDSLGRMYAMNLGGIR